MSSRDVKDERMRTAHSLQQSMGDFKDLKKFSAASVRADYRQLTRHITRYMIKVEKNGGIMKPSRMKFESKYRNLLADANDFIKEVRQFKARQEALGLIDVDRQRIGQPNYVSKETEAAL